MGAVLMTILLTIGILFYLVPEQIESLNEERAKQLLKECRDSGDWIPMRRYLEHALSTRDVLLRSFVTPLFADKIAKVLIFIHIGAFQLIPFNFC